MSLNVLIIDDEEFLRRSLADFIEDLDHRPHLAANGQEGLRALAAIHPDFVFVDLNMPVMDGYEFIARARETAPELPIVVLSGVGLVEDAMRAVRAGAWDFIPKPVTDFAVLEHTLTKNLERARLLRENREHREHLEEMVRIRTAELERTRLEVVHTLGKAAEYRDNETGNHVIRVGNTAAVLAAAVGLSERRCELLRNAAPMHDVGKIGIPDSILLKPGRLTPEEWEIMKTHTRIGYEILTPSDAQGPDDLCGLAQAPASDAPNALLALARTIALYHHERWDGTGYPCGLVGEAIPVEARIVTVVDVYDALGSERTYKEAFDEDTCRRILREGTGTHFDPRVIEAFFANIDAVMAIRRNWRD
jgi:putative two-component system response regulator